MNTVKKILGGYVPKAGEGKEFCAACGCFTQGKAAIPNETLDKVETDKPDYWTGCWRHTNASNE